MFLSENISCMSTVVLVILIVFSSPELNFTADDIFVLSERQLNQHSLKIFDKQSNNTCTGSKRNSWMSIRGCVPIMGKFDEIGRIGIIESMSSLPFMEGLYPEGVAKSFCMPEITAFACVIPAASGFEGKQMWQRKVVFTASLIDRISSSFK